MPLNFDIPSMLISVYAPKIALELSVLAVAFLWHVGGFCLFCI
jgi:hypothetical protein